MKRSAGDVRLVEAALPDFGMPATRPELPRSVYAARLSRLMSAVDAAGLSALVVYGDREHFANLAWATGFDPRFEEALLILAPGRDPMLLAGPENQGTGKAAPVGLDVRLYPPFGLLGQDRSKTPPLADLLAEVGIARGQRIGVAGWKYYGPMETPRPESWIESPSFIVDTLRTLVGEGGAVVNATALFMHASTGLRAVNEVDQLAAFEFAACHVSEAIKRVLFGLKPGMRESEAVTLMQPIGMPLSCHVMLSAGPRAPFGLVSPLDRPIERGDPFTTAYGVWGALTSRAGFVVEDAAELPEAIRDYVERLAGPYFACAAEWYETIGIGVTGGEMDALVKRHLGDPFFNLGLNPGHLIHLDEWLNTPIYPGSAEVFRSGQAFQIDIIPATGTPWFTSNIEDGVALLDERGRAEFAERHPAAWRRIEARRAFMADVLGIRLKPEVLPFSNVQGWLPPFVLAPGRVLALR
jgi:hypothetical protein